MWQLCDGIALSGWWLGIGILLRRDERSVAQLSLALAGVGIAGDIFNGVGLRCSEMPRSFWFCSVDDVVIWMLVLLRHASQATVK